MAGRTIHTKETLTDAECGRLGGMDGRTVGVEEEFLIVDPASGHAVPGFDQLVAELGERSAEVLIEKELKQQQAEIASEPRAEVQAVVADLIDRRTRLQLAARSRDLAVAALATSPLPSQPDRTPNERYDRMNDQFALVETLQLTCGMHVHVSIESRAEGVAVIDGIRPWLSVITAAAANSPYWQGVDTGYASYRTVLWGQWPSSGPTEVFGSEQVYDDVVSALISSGALLDEGMIYFDARLSRHYPTVEIRVADVGSDVDDVGTIAALCRALVETAASGNSTERQPRSELLRAMTWTACRYGLTDRLIDPASGQAAPAADVLGRLLTHVDKALNRSGERELATAGVQRLLDRGTGAQRQRRAAGEGSDLIAVVRDAVARTAPTG